MSSCTGCEADGMVQLAGLVTLPGIPERAFARMMIGEHGNLACARRGSDLQCGSTCPGRRILQAATTDRDDPVAFRGLV